ncbi:Major facilitator superfamily domain-containing protein 8 [Aphelenchoides fujianensis]|nr:Major facilitator superfamily domain-containing protein 8 [Aphelenchoides fujianensis]
MFGRAQEKKPKEYELDAEGNFAVQRTDWRSIYIGAFVAFIGSVHTHCISPVLWPFMKFAIPGVSENYYGMLQSLSSLAIAITGILAGYTSNLLKDTKWPMVFGKVMAIASCVLYLCIERMDVEGRKVAFALFEFTLGVSVGAAGIYRAHVAMTSTEEDRPKAIGICSLAPAIGIFLGPTRALPLPFGVHLNLYTAPVVLTIVISAVGAFLLVFFFDGRMRRYKKAVPSVNSLDDESSTSSSTSITVEAKYDRVAVALCLYTKMLLNLVLVSFSAIGIPYCMAAFGWSSQEAPLGTPRDDHRSSSSFLVAYLLSYPWPFLSETIPYAKPSGVNATAGFPAAELVGCNPEFAWCATTPRVNMWLFLGSLITTIGFAMPLSVKSISTCCSPKFWATSSKEQCKAR